MTVDQILQTLVTNGLAVALVIFWAWKASERETIANVRIQKLEDMVSGTLQRQLADSTAAIVRVTENLMRLEKTLIESTCPLSGMEADEANKRQKAIGLLTSGHFATPPSDPERKQ